MNATVGDIMLGSCKIKPNTKAGMAFLAPLGSRLALVVAASDEFTFNHLVSVLPLNPPYDAFPDYVCCPFFE